MVENLLFFLSLSFHFYNIIMFLSRLLDKMRPLLFLNRFLPVLLFLSLPTKYKADVYMHNPRGSNDRNCERNANRNNGNRLFDSQNNAAGGYACPRAVGNEVVQNEDGIAAFGTFDQDKRMYYYEGSWLPIEWTNQHGCGQNSEVNCEIVIQYMCEDTADPQVDNFWPWTTGKNNEVNQGQQHFRSGDNIGAPRDGIPQDAADAATDTIPDTEDAAIPDTVADRRYGMQESWDYYQLCQRTERNKGLYTADQNVRRNDQRGTRQNPNGNRNGLECPEERDHYPWWHPSPWVDIAVLSNEAGDEPCSTYNECTTQRCRYYLENSFNVAKKGYCDANHTTQSYTAKTSSSAWQNRVWFNNKADCESNGFAWYEISLSDQLDGLSPPTCMHTQYARVNQLGNAWDTEITFNVSKDSPQGLNANRYIWKIPTIPSPKTSDANYFSAGMQNAYKSCVVRLRYNISTSDFAMWPPDAMEDSHPWKYAMVTSANNSKSSNDKNTPIQQDPYVYIGPGTTSNSARQFLYLRANTNQYGRTFQDRSYKFAIKPRPTSSSQSNNEQDTPYIPVLSNDELIVNVNVRGKRGNIVQTYPSVEYNFIPDMVAMDPGDYIHFQWTGSDYNPRRGCNDGNGGPPDANDFVSASNANLNSRADRSNILFLNSKAENLPMDILGFPISDFANLDYDSQYSAAINATVPNVPCFTQDSNEQESCYKSIIRLAYLNQQQDGGSLSLRRGENCLTEQELNAINDQDTARNHPLNCANLNAKPYPYFDGGLLKMTKPGLYVYFSSRNNNFSNRDQKGLICVRGEDPSTGQQYNCTVNSNYVLEAPNLSLSTDKQRSITSSSRCEDTQNSGEANSDGPQSCLDAASGNDILTAETFTIFAANNDAYGDGVEKSCESFEFETVSMDVQNNVTLAVVISLVVAFVMFAAYYVYNRRQRQYMMMKADQEGEKGEDDEENQTESSSNDPENKKIVGKNWMVEKDTERL